MNQSNLGFGAIVLAVLIPTGVYLTNTSAGWRQWFWCGNTIFWSASLIRAMLLLTR